MPKKPFRDFAVTWFYMEVFEWRVDIHILETIFSLCASMDMGTYQKVCVSQNLSCIFEHYVECFDMWIALKVCWTKVHVCIKPLSGLIP